MKKHLLVLLVLVLFVIILPTSAQDDSADETPIVGSVWVTEQMSFPATVGMGLVTPNLIGLGGSGEALAGMTWYDYSGTLLDNVVGEAISKIISGSLTYNVCAQVTTITRDGINKGGSGRECGEIGVGSQKRASHKVWEDVHAYWVTNTWHEFSRIGTYWAPILQVSANP
jgi:hypothetical protein